MLQSRFPRLTRMAVAIALIAAGLTTSVPSVLAQASDPAPTTAQTPAPTLEPGTPPVLSPAPPAATAPTAAPTPATPNAPAPAPANPPAPRSDDQVLLDAWKGELDGITQASRRPGIFDRELVEFAERAEQIRLQATTMAQRIAPQVSALEARLRELQPPPAPAGGGGDDTKAPVVESEAVKTQRETLTRELAQARGVLQQAQEAAVRATQLSRSVTENRRGRFAEQLLARTGSVLDPAFWIDAIAALPSVTKSATLLGSDWLGVIAKRGTGTALLAILGALVVAGMLLLPVRNWLHRRTVRDADARPSRFAAYRRAFAIFLVNVMVPLLGLALVFLSLKTFDLMPRRIEQFVIAVIIATLVFFAITGLSRGLLAPRRNHWRLIPLSDDGALIVHGLLTTTAIVASLALFSNEVLGILFAPREVSVAVLAGFAITLSLLTMGVLRAIASATAIDESAEQLATDLDGRPPEAKGRLWSLLVPLSWLAQIIAMVALLAGYVPFGEFIVVYSLWVVGVIAVLFLTIGLIDEASSHAMRAGGTVSKAISRATGLSTNVTEQIGVLLSGLLRLVVLALALVFAAAPLDVTSEEIFGIVRSAFFGFQIGGLRISLSTMLGAVIVFALGIWITRAVKGWLEERLLPRTRMDAGLRNSINTSIGYVGYVIAAMVAFSFAGLDLDNIAIVAGALSVGIGFGLQSIVNNFVSGLILLAERPIKAGDLVEVNGERGYVRKINVRATEIDTFDRASLIVPNSALITGNVKNWMHRDTMGRVLIDIGVAYESDPQQVHDLMLSCAQAHPLILRFPQPGVFLVKFGESTLDFRLTAAVANVGTAFQTESDLRFSILKRMREEGVGIPYAQREVTIPTMEPLSRVAEQFLKGELPISLTPKSG